MSTIYYEMSESAENCRKSYVDHLKDRSKLISPIHGPGHSSDECKVLGEFVSDYSKSMPTKDHGQDPTKMKKFNRKQYNNSFFWREGDEIILQDIMKLSVEDKSNENIDSEVDKIFLYEIENMILDENKE